MAKEPGVRAFEEEVFPAEIEEIRARRAAAEIDTAQLDGPPSVARGLVGLALSGGGIRSATFSFGVIQALVEAGVLRSVDYLSTVSGGGYIGSCLSSLLNAPHNRPDAAAFPLHAARGEGESSTLRHLRNGSSYLATGGLLGMLRIPALLVRGILINLLLLLPVIMLAVVLTEAFYELSYHFHAPRGFVVLLVTTIFLGLVFAFPMVARVFRRWLAWPQRNFYDELLGFFLGLSLLLLALTPLWLVIDTVIEHSWGEVRLGVLNELRAPFEDQDAWKWMFLVAIVMLFLAAGKASERVGRWTGKLVLYALGLIGPLFLIGFYLVLCTLQVDSPFLDKRFGSELDEGEISVSLHTAFAERRIYLGPDVEVEVAEPDRLWHIRDGEQELIIRRLEEALHIEGMSLWDGAIDSAFFIALAALLLFNVIFVDVNITSVHGFYRDRLSKVFLIRTTPDGEVEANDRQRLSTLNAAGTVAPYHLINTALNLQGGDAAGLRWRKADFFIFSKRFTGSPSTGYCETTALEGVDDHLDLATAMAISAAAAAPNMGQTTVRSLVLILTLLNIRLGYWLPSPARVERGALYRRLLLRGAGPRFLFRESLSNLTASGAYVNVSDGGHVENLGIYELLRRRCALIIAVDGEADPGLRFPSLVQLIRYARIDLGVEIDIDLTDLYPGDQNLSRRHWTLGSIDYGNGDYGHLLYIKSSVSGDESLDVRTYRRLHPAFPHQSTADQFFNEEQFEAYRALGHHVGRGVMASEDANAVLHEHGVITSPQ